jgi:hypothetical protein
MSVVAICSFVLAVVGPGSQRRFAWMGPAIIHIPFGVFVGLFSCRAVVLAIQLLTRRVPLLSYAKGQLRISTLYGRRQIDLARVTSIDVVQLRGKSVGLEIHTADRSVRVGFGPEQQSWEDLAATLGSAVELAVA